MSHIIRWRIFYIDYFGINMVYINYIKIFDAEIYNP